MPETTTTNLDFPVKHESAFAAYRMWRSIPVLLRHPPKGKEQFAESLGFDDEDFVQLVNIPNKKAFAERFGVSQNTITAWEKKLHGTSTFDQTKQWATGLTKNLIMHLYSQTMRTGNPALFKLWFELFTDYKESARKEIDRPNITHFNVSVRTSVQV